MTDWFLIARNLLIDVGLRRLAGGESKLHFERARWTASDPGSL